MNNEILSKIDEIINDIEKSPEYLEYLFLKDKIAKNKELMSLINSVRLLQKDYVHHLIKKDELDKIVSELNDYPLYREYLCVLDKINNTYAILENSLNNYFQNKIN